MENLYPKESCTHFNYLQAVTYTAFPGVKFTVTFREILQRCPSAAASGDRLQEHG